MPDSSSKGSGIFSGIPTLDLKPISGRVLRGTCTRRVQSKGDLHEHVGKFMQRSAAIITEGHNPGYIENAVQSFKAANVNPVGRPRKNA